eukprot:COSAG02_NODE_7_length_64539_cov_120.393482_13_plen_188_part_00
MASTTIGVLFSVLLTNKCTLGKGAPTCKDCWRAARMLCVDDCCCGRRRHENIGTRAPLLAGAHSHVEGQNSSSCASPQRISINSADNRDNPGSTDAHLDLSRSRRVSDASDTPDSIEGEPQADAHLQDQNIALTRELQLKAQECEALRLRVAELERQLGQHEQEQEQAQEQRKRSSSSQALVPGGSE